MAADLGLVVDAAEGEADAPASRRPGDGLGDTGLARARRADEAEKAPFHLGRELAHGEVLQDPFLDLFQTVVVGVEHLARLLRVDGLLRADAPGDLQTDVEIAADNGRLGRAEGLLLQLGKLFEELFADLVGDGKGLDLRTVCIEIVALAVRAKLGLDQLELLPQEVFALAAVDLLLRGVVELLFDVQDLDLWAM